MISIDLFISMQQLEFLTNAINILYVLLPQVLHFCSLLYRRNRKFLNRFYIFVHINSFLFFYIIIFCEVCVMAEGIDSKKTEFKNYLEKTGAVDQLTKILVQLYEENQRPQNSVDYIRRYLGASGDVDADKLQKDYDDAQAENQRLKKQIEQVKKQIQKRKK